MLSCLADRRRFLASAVSVSGALCMPVTAQERAIAKGRFAIAIHGGAGRSPPDESKAVEASLAKVLEMGVEILKKDGTSLDAVEQVIRFLEDDPLFNAGKGGRVQSRRRA